MQWSSYIHVLSAALIAVSIPAHAAEISDVQIVEITGDSATVEWITDVDTDATINYGLDPNVGTVRYPRFDKKEHSLTIENLEPSTTYYFRVVSAEPNGNRAATGGFVFTTKALESTPSTPQVTNPQEQAVVERIVQDLQQIRSPQAIEVIQDAVQDRAGEIVKPPSIVGPPRVFAEETSAEIIWTTDRDSTSMVHLVPESEYDPDSTDPYTIEQGDTGTLTRNHRVTVIGLEPSTTYHFRVVSEDSLGLRGEGSDDTFTTKSILPRITALNVTRIQETSATVNWSTGNVLAKGVVEYTNLRTRQTQTAGNAVFATTQSLQLTGLEFGTRYSAVVVATNQAGDIATSDPFTFVTVRDIIAPAISKVNNESTLFPGEDTKIQTIMSWETDEPSYCQVFYTQGLVLPEGETGDSLPEETNPVTSHIQVVVGFAPATVYKFWMNCRDESFNESRSEDFVLITPIREKNIIDIILENFEGTFGWLKNIGG